MAIAVSDAPLQIYLASGSPRRAELLTQIGVRFERVSAPIDEASRSDEAARAYVERMAREKALAGLQVLGEACLAPVLGADTSVVIDGRILGKPHDRDDALAMLAALSAREHEVVSAVAVATVDRCESIVQSSRVRFAELSSACMSAYWDSGEPADKAGSYGIQGLGAIFVAGLQGSYSGVMGLPLHETADLLEEFGVRVL